MRKRSGTLVRDMIGSALYVAPVQAIIPLSSFIAAKRLDAPVIWLGLMITGTYLGLFWNMFFSRFTARVSLGKGIVRFMLASAVFVLIAGFQTNGVLYCLFILVFLVFVGLYNVQYAQMVEHLHPPEVRHKRLSYRHLAIFGTAAALTIAFGKISVSSYRAISVVSAGMICVAAMFFNSLRTDTEHYMVPFRARDVISILLEDRNLRMVAVLVAIYGIVGAGLNAPLSLLYKKLGYSEDTVGILTAVRIGGTIIASAFVTPRLRFPGGIPNFRFPLMMTTISISIFFVTSILPSTQASFWILALANFCFGFNVSAFMVAVQVTALGLAPPGKTSIYVNAQMIVLGIRGLVWPIIVGVLLQITGLIATMGISVGAMLLCVFLAFTLKLTPRS